MKTLGIYGVILFRTDLALEDIQSQMKRSSQKPVRLSDYHLAYDKGHEDMTKRIQCANAVRLLLKSEGDPGIAFTGDSKAQKLGLQKGPPIYWCIKDLSQTSTKNISELEMPMMVADSNA